MPNRKNFKISQNLLTKLDLKILKIVKNQKDIGILELCDSLHMKHRGLKSHIYGLLKLKFIEEQEKQKHGKIPLMITNDGEKILEIFDRNLK